jgi:hypothetical protein
VETAARHTATVPPENAIDPPAGGGEAIDPGTLTDPPAASAAARRPRTIFSAADRASFARLAASLPGREGVAVSSTGLGRRVERLGSLHGGVAWSTSKVPVAMAVLAQGGGQAHQADLAQALTASDNAAAERLWASLGGGAAAAQAADEQLRAAGDEHTMIQAQTLRAGYTPFGQTEWALTDQARFTAGLGCTREGTQVLGLMGRVVGGQRWGLGSAGVPWRLKGGWGPGITPGEGDGWLDRQMGVLTIRGRQLAVAIATAPGSHGTGTSNLTALARWVAAHASTATLSRAPRC